MPWVVCRLLLQGQARRRRGRRARSSGVFGSAAMLSRKGDARVTQCIVVAGFHAVLRLRSAGAVDLHRYLEDAMQVVVLGRQRLHGRYGCERFLVASVSLDLIIQATSSLKLRKENFELWNVEMMACSECAG